MSNKNNRLVLADKYLLSGYMNSADPNNITIGRYQPIAHTLLFARAKTLKGCQGGTGLKGKNGAKVSQELVLYGTDGHGKIRRLDGDFNPRDCHKVLDHDAEFFLPPMNATAHLYATKGGDPDKNDAWLAEVDKLFEGIESVKLEYKTLQFPGKFREPLPKESVPDFQLEQEETYSAWYKRMQAKAKTAGRPIAISGYFIPRVRAVIVAFSSNAFERGLVEIWHHGMEYEKAKEKRGLIKAEISKPKASGGSAGSDEPCAAVLYANDKRLPVGMYNIKVTVPKMNFSNKGLFAKHASSDDGIDSITYVLKERLRFNINTIAGEFDLINGDPISVEETMLLKFPIQYKHLTQVASDWQRWDKTKKGQARQVAKKAGIETVLHNIEVTAARTQLALGVLSADRPSTKFWAYSGIVKEGLISYGEKTKPAQNIMNLLFQPKAIYENYEALQDAYKNTKKFVRLSREMNPVRALISTFDDGSEEIAQVYRNTLAARLKIPEEFMRSAGNMMAIAETALKLMAVGSQIHTVYKLTLNQEENEQNLDKIVLNYHQQVHEDKILHQGKQKAVVNLDAVDFFNDKGERLPQKGKLPECKVLPLQLRYFVTDSSDLTAQQEKELKTFSESYNKLLDDDKYTSPRIVLFGLSSTIGGYDYNYGLSVRRAQTVRDYLIKHCKVKPEQIQIVGLGEVYPVLVDNKEKQLESQRVEGEVVFWPAEPSYAPSREGIANIEKLRQATVAGQLGLLDEYCKTVVAVYDAVVGVLMMIPGVQVIAAAVEVARELVGLVVAFGEFLDDYTGNFVGTILAHNKLLRTFIDASVVNQDYIREKAAVLYGGGTPGSGKRELDLRDELDLHFRLRAEAFYGLGALLVRAAIETNNDTDYDIWLKNYKVSEYIENYILNDRWLFSLDNYFHVGIDEYWMYCVDTENLTHFHTLKDVSLDSAAKLVDNVDQVIDKAWVDTTAAIDKGCETAFHPILGAKHLYFVTTLDLPESIKAKFNSYFPVHRLENDFKQFSRSFKTAHSELGGDIYRYTCVYIRVRGSQNKDDWRPLEKFLDKHGDLRTISPFFQVRVLIVLKESVKRGDKDQSLLNPYPVTLQVQRSRLIFPDNYGPKYFSTVHALQETELLPHELKEFKGAPGVVIHPFFQIGQNTVPGIKPMESGFLDAKVAYDWGFLTDMDYKMTVTIGAGVAAGKLTKREIRILGDDKEIKSGDDKKFGSIFNVSVDINRVHIIPKKNKVMGFTIPYAFVQDEHLLISNAVIHSGESIANNPPHIFKSPRFTSYFACIKFGKKGPIIAPNPYNGEEKKYAANNMTVSVSRSMKQMEINELTLEKYDWSEPVEIFAIIAVHEDGLRKEETVKLGYNWREFGAKLELLETTNWNVIGPSYPAKMQYIGNINKSFGPLNYNGRSFGDISTWVFDGATYQFKSKLKKNSKASLRQLAEYVEKNLQAVCTSLIKTMRDDIWKENLCLFAASTKLYYQSLAGKMVEGIRPLDDGRDFKSKEPFNFSIKLKMPEHISDDAPVEKYILDLIVPAPDSYYNNVPWLEEPPAKEVTTLDPTLNTKAKDANPVWLAWKDLSQEEKQAKIRKWMTDPKQTKSVSIDMGPKALKP